MRARRTECATAYYRTLYSKYRVDDAYLQSRAQRRATGAFLERIENERVRFDQPVSNQQVKRLRRAFGLGGALRLTTKTVTVGALLLSLQAAPNANAAIGSWEGGVDDLVTVADQSMLVETDDDSFHVDDFRTSSSENVSLHLMTMNPPVEELPELPADEFTVATDDDSDIDPPAVRLRTLTVIDTTSVEDWQVMRDAVEDGDVLLLSAGDDPLAAIEASLKDLGTVDALNVISHGASGLLALGDHVISLETLKKQEARWRRIGAHIEGDGDILLFGCNVAAGERGKRFVQELAAMTGADVAASVDVTGHSDFQGDWDLEAATGLVVKNAAVSNLNGWRGALPTYNFSRISTILPTGSYTLSGTLFNGTDAFKIKPTYPMRASSSGFVYFNRDTTATYTFYLRPNETTLESFDITEMEFSNGCNSLGNGSFTTLDITGYLKGGGTVVTAPTLPTTMNTNQSKTMVGDFGGDFSSFNDITKLRVDAAFSGGHICAYFENMTLSDLKAPVPNSDGTLVAAPGVAEPVDLVTSAVSTGTAVNVFDFRINDGGGDVFPLDVSAIRLNLAGAASGNFSKMRFNLSGCASQTSVAPSGSTVTFSGLSLSVPNNSAATCTVSAFWADNTNISDNQTFSISIDGDTDLTVDAAKTGMTGSNASVSTGNMSTEVVASKLAFSTQPAGAVSLFPLSTQPVVRALDAADNLDADYAVGVTLTEASAGTLAGGSATASGGVATFTAVAYSATADQEAFTLTASSGSLTNAVSNSVTADVIATNLRMTTQPAPLTVVNGQATSLTTVPVIEGVNSVGIRDTGFTGAVTLGEVLGSGTATLSAAGDSDGSPATVTLNATAGVVSFDTLQLTYTNSGSTDENFNLQATSAGVASITSSQFTSIFDNTPPTLTSFARQTPATSPTNADSLTFRATFDEDVQNVSAADFAAAGTTATVSNVVAVDAATYDITVSGGDLAGLDGTVGLNLAGAQDIADLASNDLPAGEPATDETYTLDNMVPTVSSITRQTPMTTSTNADTLVFRVIFSETVQDVSAGTFTVNGSTTATVTGVSGSGDTYDVTVSGGDLAGFDGVVGLDLASVVAKGNPTVTDVAGNDLATTEPATDETYTVDNDAPSALSFAPKPPNTSPTNANVVVFRAIFDEDVQNVDAADFSATGTTGTVSVVNGIDATTYDITVSGGDLAALNGTVGLDLAGGQNITDVAGNALPAGEPATDETYTLDNIAPTITSITRQTPMTTPTNADTLVFRVTFSEDVENVATDRFRVTGGTTATVTNVSTATADSVFDVTVSGGDLADFDGTVGLGLNTLRKGVGALSINDPAGNVLDPAAPATDETYTLDNTGPVLLSITLPPGAVATTNADTLVLRLTFDGDAQNVDVTDVIVTGGSTAMVTGLTTVTPDTVFDLEISGGDLATFSGTVGLASAPGQDIADSLGNPFEGAEPAISEVYQLVVVEAEDDAYTVAEGDVLGVALGNGLLANDSALDINTLLVIAIDGMAVVGTAYTPTGGGTLTVSADGTLSFDTGDAFESLNDGEESTVTFTYTASDGDTEETATGTITVTGRDDTLVAQDDGFTTREDRAVSGNVLEDNGNGIDFGGEADEVLVTTPGTFDADGIGGEVVLGTDGAFTYTPPANEFGTATFDYTVADNTVLTDTATVTIEVTPINDAPSFTAGPDQTLANGAELIQRVAGWATDISAGPNEDDQNVRFEVSTVSDPDGVLDGDVTVSRAGELRYTLTGNGGTAEVSVNARDNGGRSGGGVNRSSPVTFEIELMDIDVAQVILRRGDTNKWHMYLMDGFTKVSNGNRPFSPNRDWTTQGIADMNGDGVEDLVIRNSSNNFWHVYYLNGATGQPNSSRHISVSGDPDDEFQGLGDLNGDGIGDVLTRNSDTGEWKGWYLTASGELAFTQVLAIDVSDTTVTQGIADFDGDGTDELLLRSTSDGRWTAYTFAAGTGEVTGSRSPNLTRVSDWVFEGAGDFDGNGRDDVLMRRTDDGRWLIYTFTATGDRESQRRVGLTPRLEWQLQWLDDFDGDGNTDALLRRTDTNVWRLYQLDGTTILDSGRVPLTPQAIWQTQTQ
ncbi:MAG: DUF4347 domain-containing protein [Pseudomonadota bacterium]